MTLNRASARIITETTQTTPTRGTELMRCRNQPEKFSKFTNDKPLSLFIELKHTGKITAENGIQVFPSHNSIRKAKLPNHPVRNIENF